MSFYRQAIAIFIFFTAIHQARATDVTVFGLYFPGSSMTFSGNFIQQATGTTRMGVTSNTLNVPPSFLGYSQVKAQGQITLGGTLEVVLWPDLFDASSYTPRNGDTFDFFSSSSGISLEPGFSINVLIGRSPGTLSWLNLLPYTQRYAGDIDANNLYYVTDQLFDFSLVNNDTVLRGTLNSTHLSSPVPLPAAIWLFLSALIGLIGLGRRKH